MATTPRRIFTALIFTLTMACTRSAWADDVDRIRTEDANLMRVLAAGAERSVTFRSLVQRVQHSDLIVYLTCARFPSSSLRGRTRLAAVGPRVRYVRVDVECFDLFANVAPIVAHELQHVVEIADAPHVVDGRTLATHYGDIGFRSCAAGSGEQFETSAAQRVGEQVRRELERRPAAPAPLVASADANVRTAPEGEPRTSAADQPRFQKRGPRN